jgi:SAM-dependent methyltransferase
VIHRDAEDWEALARNEPYFPVLGTDGRVARPSDEFFATGEMDVAALLAALRSLLGREVPLGTVLDFGCGAGRLTLPLARRAEHVVGCDIAPTNLARARANAEGAGLTGIELVQDCAALADSSFDFICSLCVFEHIPASQGYTLIRRLATLLAPGGIAAIQLPLGSRPRRVRLPERFRPRISPSRLRMADVLAGVVNTEENVYSDRRVHHHLAAAGARPVARMAIGDSASAVMVFERPARL